MEKNMKKKRIEVKKQKRDLFFPFLLLFCERFIVGLNKQCE